MYICTPATPGAPSQMWMFFYLGLPLSQIPILLINWRICCAFITTYTWKFQRVSPLHQSHRGMRWILVRYALKVPERIPMDMCT